MVLVAAVVGAVHLEALGQACMATGGPGEVQSLARHPPHSLMTTSAWLPSQLNWRPQGLRATQLLPPHVLPAHKAQDPGPRREGGGRRVTEAASPGQDSPGLCRLPAEAPCGGSIGKKRRRSRRPRGTCVLIVPNLGEVVLARIRPVLPPGSLRGLPGDWGALSSDRLSSSHSEQRSPSGTGKYLPEVFASQGFCPGGVSLPLSLLGGHWPGAFSVLPLGAPSLASASTLAPCRFATRLCLPSPSL